MLCVRAFTEQFIWDQWEADSSVISSVFIYLFFKWGHEYLP